MTAVRIKTVCLGVLLLVAALPAPAAEDWLQLKYDARRSGDVPQRSVSAPLGLVGAVPLGDAVFTAPVVADGKVYVVDGSGVVWAIDAASLRVVWRYETAGGKANCNNISSPAIAGGYLHVGTMAGKYYVLDAATGAVVHEIDCGEPIFSAPAVGQDRVYFATLGSRVYSLRPDGTVVWVWDFVRERLGFTGDRWNGVDWKKQKGQATWREQFCCTRDIALDGRTIVLPAGGTVVWLEDVGEKAAYRGVFLGNRESPATLGLSIGPGGTVYRQWTQRDNTGRVEVLEFADGKVKSGFVRGTETSYNGPGLMSFSSVSIRGGDVYRCRPEQGFGLCRHSGGQTKPLDAYPSISSPILLRDAAVVGGLDGALHVVPLASGTKPWSFHTPLGKAISAPVAVCDGRIYFGCEDGYLYALGPGASAPLPTKDLGLEQLRSPLAVGPASPAGSLGPASPAGSLGPAPPAGSLGPAPPAEDRQKGEAAGTAGPTRSARPADWFTSFGNWANTNATKQPIKLPLKLHWIRRFEGSVKHMSVCGGGRMYTHTAEGQVFAVEQETGRLLWRRYFPGVHVSYTSPLYYQVSSVGPASPAGDREKGEAAGKAGPTYLLVPQAGLKECWLRCLDPATGRLLWQAPFTGSPSWNRQLPPIVWKNLVIYQFSSGRYTPQSWLFEHQSTFGFPADQKPLVRAWDLQTGKEVWTRDFSQYGAGGDDAGMCLMDDTLYYSCYFGNKPVPGVTAAMNPATGEVQWVSTKHSVHAGCTVSGKDGRLYLGGYNPVEGDKNVVWCLDARDGSLVWKSEPVLGAIHVVTVADKFLFAHAQYRNAYLLDRETGKILATLAKGYRCTRFTYCDPYLIGSNFDLFDLSGPPTLLSSGPQLDVLMCVGAIMSNGRLFLTTNGSGLQASMRCGEEAGLRADASGK
jgi:outer membrane protein assembly factor BamB